jgi:hypothetical protein
MEYFREAMGEENEENIIFGFGEDDSTDEFRVTLIATGFDPDMQNLPQTNGMPTYVQQPQPPAPVANWRTPAQPVQQAPAQPTYQPTTTGAWNAWQQPTQEGSGSIAARSQRPSGAMPVAAQAGTRPAIVRREPSGSHIAVAPLSNRTRGSFVPDLDESMDDDIDKPAYLRQRA